MTQQTPARSFFEGIANSADPVASIRGLISSTSPREETDWLDCKTEHQDPRQRDKSYRQGWSENLSAFANTGGGVLIWGLNARRENVNGREVDHIKGESLIDDPETVAARLREWQGQATNPTIPGVEVKAFTTQEDPSKGFVLCFVPEGSLKPYQSTQTTDKQYYLRGGCSNFVMDRAVLASLFYPRSLAHFLVRAKLSWAPEPGLGPDPVYRNGSLNVHLSVTNNGKATAKDVCVNSRLKLIGKLTLPFALDSARMYEAGDGQYRSTLTTSLHPGQSLTALRVLADVKAQDFSRFIFSQNKWPALLIDATIYCENQNPQSASFNFSLERTLYGDAKEIEESAIEV